MSFKILFSNIGYARGINGTLSQHFFLFHRHFYFASSSQQQVLMQLRDMMHANAPDLCCFVEIDSGSFTSAYINQLEFLRGDYAFFDIADKYGMGAWPALIPFRTGKSAAFLSRQDLPFERLYFRAGSKRLIYRLTLPGDVDLFFCHFSLQKRVRMQQFLEMRHLIISRGKPAVVMADFNIMQGFDELQPLLQDTDLRVLNDHARPTFRFGGRRLALDLCICSEPLAPLISLSIIPQPFSDHEALLVEGRW